MPTVFKSENPDFIHEGETHPGSCEGQIVLWIREVSRGRPMKQCKPNLSDSQQVELGLLSKKTKKEQNQYVESLIGDFDVYNHPKETAPGVDNLMDYISTTLAGRSGAYQIGVVSPKTKTGHSFGIAQVGGTWYLFEPDQGCKSFPKEGDVSSLSQLVQLVGIKVGRYEKPQEIHWDVYGKDLAQAPKKSRSCLIM